MTDIYRIHVTLKYAAPPIWRRIEVPADIRLGRLHRILQTVMGWTDSHLHAFRAGDVTYGVPDPDFPDATRAERNVRLDKIAAPGDTFIYEYDFGDGWEHELKIEKVLPADYTIHYPRCIAGERACPPEDCGGPPGYEDLLAALGDPAHPEHEAMHDWAGPGFDPERFDLAEVNRLLWRLR
ncbi:MAG: plasmid pRiA4b ORF-3 family protein [Gammaproteobacteria bacterium]